MRPERSAGGVVVRGAGEGAEVVVVSPRQGVYALPKGHPEGGETMEQAAVREETGRGGRAERRAGDVHYWYTRAGRRVLKVVTFFLFDYRSGSVEDHDDEVESAEWVALAEAPRLLSYKAEREMVSKARARTG